MNDLTNKSKKMLSGLVALGGLGLVGQAHAIRASVMQYSYGAFRDSTFGDLQGTSGLSTQELTEIQKLVGELNQLDIVVGADVEINEAPRVVNRYNLPEDDDLRAAEASNKARLEKLRKLVQASQESR